MVVVAALDRPQSYVKFSKILRRWIIYENIGIVSTLSHPGQPPAPGFTGNGIFLQKQINARRYSMSLGIYLFGPYRRLPMVHIVSLWT